MTTEMTYRRSFINGASPIGLILALFDTLVGDYQRAASAIRANDLEARCREINHALLVLAHLESWIDLNAGGESAQNLAGFYAYLRAKSMEASSRNSIAILQDLIEMILHVRTSWQALDSSPIFTGQGVSAGNAMTSYSAPSTGEEEQPRFSRSA